MLGQKHGRSNIQNKLVKQICFVHLKFNRILSNKDYHLLKKGDDFQYHEIKQFPMPKFQCQNIKVYLSLLKQYSDPPSMFVCLVKISCPCHVVD